MTLPKLEDIKSWNVDIEKKITAEWVKKGNKFNKKAKKIYSIDTPPPYVNTPIHMGHAVTYSYMDFFARFRRLLGEEVLFPLGLDRNGLPIEIAAEKKFEVSPFKVGREEFLKLCEKILEESSKDSIESFARLGISFNSYKEGEELGEIYTTDSEKYRQLTQDSFIDLYKKELIYEDVRINNWDPKLRTTVADSEIDYEEKPSNFNHIVFRVKETGEKITIGTTRPELIASCGMVIFNPDDKRYKKLDGLTAITPIYEKEVPIRDHPFAHMDKGTGLVMMCSAGDVTDIQFFREMNLKPIISINADGTMNDNAGFLKGLKVKEAREKIIDELKKENLLVKQDKIMHKTPISERSKAEIEFIEMPEFYLKQIDFRDKLKKIVNEINFYPEEARENLMKWIDSVSIDWPISRRRYYATPIPLWHSGKYTALPQKGKYHTPWKQKVPADADVFEKGVYTGKKAKDLDLKWEGETRVFDTWFDSSFSGFFILGHPKEFTKNSVSLRPQGKEIMRTWLYYSLLRGYHETGKKLFENVWIHNHITDASGRKMSKSLGNVIDPMEIINKEGSEALRLWAALEGNIAKQDLSCSLDRIRGEQKTINKLLNVAKFISQFKKAKKPKKLCELDSLFMQDIDNLVVNAKENFSEYDFHNSLKEARYFLWEKFASHYVEMVKARTYNQENKFSKEESASGIYSLYYILEKLNLIFYPVIPQVTSVIAESLDFSIEFPEIKKTEENRLIKDLMEFNTDIWKKKKDLNLSLRSEIKEKVPVRLKKFESDLKACHNLIQY